MLFRNAKHHSISLRRVFPAIRGVLIPLLPVEGPIQIIEFSFINQ
nr:MAG TPA: hypothetical protein [Caudoviricetes sp.]